MVPKTGTRTMALVPRACVMQSGTNFFLVPVSVTGLEDSILLPVLVSTAISDWSLPLLLFFSVPSGCIYYVVY